MDRLRDFLRISEAAGQARCLHGPRGLPPIALVHGGASVRRRDSLQTSAGGGSWGTWTKRFATILAGHPNSPRWPLAAARG